MDVFFNEKCLNECVDIESTLTIIHQNLNILTSAKIRPYTCIDELLIWKKIMQDEFDFITNNYFNEIMKLLEECPETSPQSYYYHFSHQDDILSISNNLFPSSIVFATEKFLSKQLVIIFNLPNSKFNKRPFLPVLKSPFNSKKRDELVNIPCFDTAERIKQFVFLQDKIKKKIKHDKFEAFYEKYFSFVGSFDFDNWKPNIIVDGKLIQANSFPVCNINIIADEIATWKINKSSTEDNIAQYKILGGLVLELNGYVRNNLLSSHYEYEIYEGGSGSHKLLISLDVENGLFEAINMNGIHIGVYNYSGKYKHHYSKQKDIDSHSLINIPNHMFILKNNK